MKTAFPLGRLKRKRGKELDVIEFQFDDQFLDALIEVMKSLAGDLRSGQESVALFSKYRNQLIDRFLTVGVVKHGKIGLGLPRY